MPSSYPIYDVTDWFVLDVEPEGEDIKYWLFGSAGESERHSWLFKQATIKDVPVKGGGFRTYRQGEDWAEKAASALAALVGLPAATVELAYRDGSPGVLSRNIKPDRWSLHGGGVWIAEIDSRYRPRTSSDPRRNRVGHNLDNISQILEGVGPPPGFERGDFSAFDTFAGYLLFDAWIANRDRHEFNWALMQDPRGQLYLGPSFDHAAALGSGLEDDQRARVLQSGQVGNWCRRGTAHRFEDCGDTPLLDVARSALERASAAARRHWLEKVLTVTRSEWDAVLVRIPMLSEVGRTFTSEVLRVNQERIGDESNSRH